MKGMRVIKSQVLAETGNQPKDKDASKVLPTKEVSVVLDNRTRIFVVGPGEEKDQIFIRLLKDDYFFPGYFQVKLSLKQLYAKNNRFKSCGTVEELCKYFVSLIEAKNVEIGSKKSDDEIIISFFLPEVPYNIKIEFIFKKETFSLKEYKAQINKGISEIRKSINEFKSKNGLLTEKEIKDSKDKEKKNEGDKKKKGEKKEINTYPDFKSDIESLFRIIENLKIEKKKADNDSSGDSDENEEQ